VLVTEREGWESEVEPLRSDLADVYHQSRFRGGVERRERGRVGGGGGGEGEDRSVPFVEA